MDLASLTLVPVPLTKMLLTNQPIPFPPPPPPAPSHLSYFHISHQFLLVGQAC